MKDNYIMAAVSPTKRYYKLMEYRDKFYWDCVSSPMFDLNIEFDYLEEAVEYVVKKGWKTQKL